MAEHHDITFDAIHDRVQSGNPLNAADFPPIKIGGLSCRLVAVDAEGYGKQRLLDATHALDQTHPTEAYTIPADHGFYQLYYALERHGTPMGDLSIQLERGASTAWISAWDATRQIGVGLGAMPLPTHDVAKALAAHVQQQPAFAEHFGETPIAAIDTANLLAKSPEGTGKAK